jgi:exodeoxyribonuclease-3
MGNYSDGFLFKEKMNNKMKLFKPFVAIIFFAICSLQINGQSNFKILTYNTWNGFQGDSLIQKQYVHWVKKINPDVIAYQEMTAFTQLKTEKLAEQYNHNYAVQVEYHTAKDADCCPVALSSKYPTVNVQKVVDNMWHSYIYANIKDIHMFVLHFSPFSSIKRSAEVKMILAHAATIPPNEKIVIMGDFNSFSEDDSETYDERKKDYGALEYSIPQAMKEAGFKDAYRIFHQNFKHSCPTKRKSGAPARIDYMWLNPEMAKYVVSADYIHDEDTDYMSDHYPLLVAFKLK